MQPLSSQGRVRYQQQHEFSTEHHHEGSKEVETRSSPPHSLSTTTGTTSTPTSLGTDASSPLAVSPGRPSSIAKEAIASSTDPNFPNRGPRSAPEAHHIASDAPTHSEGSDEAQWEHPIQAQHSTSAQRTIGVDPSYSPGVAAEESTFPSAIKLLVSNNVAGSIIGRSGQTISELQAQSSTRIKLSQTGDYFPGTQDRVCLIQGQAENVKMAMSLLLSRLFALQQQNHLQNVSSQQEHHHLRATPDHLLGTLDSLQPSSIVFNFVVRILVPSSSCGMIIGKGGSSIKQMVDASGVSSVRLSPKEGSDTSADSFSTNAALASATAERVVTVTGPDLNSCIKCSFIILDGMTSHPDICRYANMTTSYSRAMLAVHTYDVAAATAATYPVMPVSSQEPIPRGVAPSLWDPGFVQPPHQEDLAGSFDMAPVSPSIYRTSLSGPPGFASSPSSPHFFRGQGGVPSYSPMFGGPAPFMVSSPDARAYQPSPVRAPIPRSHSSTCLPFGQTAMGVDASLPMPPNASSPDLLALQFQETLRMSDSHHGVSMDHSPAQFAHGGSLPQQYGFTVQVAIPDSLIGSILGRGGRTLNELQMQSNTRIRISQRGEYVPGTRNRIVTIRGPTAQSVTIAQMLMSQRMVLPPTAVSPTPAFPIIQPVELSYEQQQQGSPYRPSSSTATPHTSSHDDSRQDPRASPHIHPSS